MILSTGMCTLDEIDRTNNVLKNKHIEYAFLNCVSEYPPVYSDINIDVLTILKHRYPDVVIGHSDHTPDLYTSFAAVTIGAKIIEKHVTLDKTQEGPDQSVSMSFFSKSRHATASRSFCPGAPQVRTKSRLRPNSFRRLCPGRN